MEVESEEKEKAEDIQNKLQDPKILSRPTNFSLQRRSEVYYFSDGNERGILKRVPVKDGTYRMNEQKTVLEDSNAAKDRNKIWSDNQLNSCGSLMANENNSATKNDDSYESIYRDKETNNFLKSLDEIAGYKQQEDDLNNPAKAEAYKNNLRTKDNDQDPAKASNQDQKESFYKPFKGFKKEMPQSNVSAEIDSEKLKGSISQEKQKKLSILKKRSFPSTKSEVLKDSHECLRERCTETSLNEALSKMQLKTPTTEL